MSPHHQHPILPLVALQWPLLICELLLFGIALFALVVVPPFPTADARIRNRAVWAIRVLSLIGLLWMPVLILNQTAEMAGVSLLAAMPLVGEVIHQTHAGRVWSARLCGMIVLAVLAWLPGKSTIKLTVLLDSPHCCSHCARSPATRSTREPGRWFCISSMKWLPRDGSVRCSACGWGSPAWNRHWPAICLLPPRRACHAWRAGASRFWAGSGLYQAYLGLGLNLDHLLYSAYGRTLLYKLVLAAAVIAIGANNRYRLVPNVTESTAAASLRRNVAMECLMLSGVVAISAVLANTPPAH